MSQTPDRPQAQRRTVHGPHESDTWIVLRGPVEPLRAEHVDVEVGRSDREGESAESREGVMLAAGRAGEMNYCSPKGKNSRKMKVMTKVIIIRNPER